MPTCKGFPASTGATKETVGLFVTTDFRSVLFQDEIVVSKSSKGVRKRYLKGCGGPVP